MIEQTPAPPSQDPAPSQDPVAADIRARRAASGDIVAGEQVLDEGRVAPDQDDLSSAGADAEGDPAPNSGEDLDRRPHAPNHDDDAEHAADPRTDAGAPPAQPEPPG